MKNKSKRNSIKGIAAELGVSVTTVSFVLNGKAKEKRISEAVTKKILDYIELIGYRPNQLAQSLRTGKSKIIVFMVEDISNHFFSRLARIIEDIAYQKGYKVLFCSNENDDKKSLELIDLFKERQVDGFMIVPSPGIQDKIAALKAEKIPVVLCDRYFPDLDIDHVIIDNEKASYCACEHLIKNNFKNIALITTDVRQTQMLGRLEGYKKAMAAYQLPTNVLILPYKEKTTLQGKESITKFFYENPDLDAAFFTTNYLTKNGLAVIKESFPNALNKMGIVTFDDNELFTIYTPTITAVSQPLEEMAKELMKTMLALLKNPKVAQPPKKIVLKAKLVVRESSKVKE